MVHYAFENPGGYLTPNGFICQDISVNLLGSLPAIAWDWSTAYGLDLHKDVMKRASHICGGHATLRTFVNCLIAETINQVLKEC